MSPLQGPLSPALAAPVETEKVQLVIHADDLDSFGRDALDPMATGLRGPTLGMTTRAYRDVRKRLAERVGIFRAVVTKPPTDVWSAGWEVETDNPALVEAAREWDAQVIVYPDRRGIKNAFKRAHILARRDGRSLLLYQLTGAGLAASRPALSTGKSLRVRVIPDARIGRIEQDPETGDIERVEILATAGDMMSAQWVDGERVQVIIEEPDEDAGNDLLGKAIIDVCLLSGHALVNIRWAATEAYFGHACPLYVLSVDKDTKLTDADVKNIQAQLKSLSSNVNRKAWFKGGEITALFGSTTLPDPTPFAELQVNDIAAATGIPKRELTGDEAGALEAAEADMRRYASTVVNTLRDEFGAGALLVYYERMRAWGFLPAEGQINGIHWYPLLQLTEKEQASQLSTIGDALLKFAKLRIRNTGGMLVPIRIPQELLALFTPNADDDFSQPIEVIAETPFGAPSPAGAPKTEPKDAAPALGEEPAARADAQIELSPVLLEIEERLEDALRSAFRKWRQQVAGALGTSTAKADGFTARIRRRLRSARADEIPREVERTLLTLTFNDEELAAIIEDALHHAAQLGTMRTWAELGKPGVLKFLDTPQARTLSQHARTYSAEKAAAATQRVREVVADALVKGGGLREVEAALNAAFDGLENRASIARTEAMRGYNNGSLASMKEAGIEAWEFQAYGDACPICDTLNGQVFSVDDATNMPPTSTHPNCRCVPTARIPAELTS